MTIVRYNRSGLRSNEAITTRSSIYTSIKINIVDNPNYHKDPVNKSKWSEDIWDSSEITFDLAVLNLIEEKQEKFRRGDEENENNCWMMEHILETC